MEIKGSNLDYIYTKLVTKLLASPESTITNKSGDTLYEESLVRIILTEPSRNLAHCRAFSKTYLEGELDFYFSGSLLVDDIAKYSSFWKGISDDGIHVNSNYGFCLLHLLNYTGLTQYQYAFRVLKRNLETKKAVMVIYNPNHARDSKDNPCTMNLQYFYRDGRLHLLVNMRSSDVWFGLPYDIPFFCNLLLMMAGDLGVPVGNYYHDATSLHMYARNVPALTKIMMATPSLSMERNYEEFISNDLIPVLRRKYNV